MSDTVNSKIDWKKAHYGARLSNYAYEKFEEDEELLTPFLKKEELELIYLINQKDTGTQGFIARKDSLYHLVFRGTEKDGLDIISDLNAKLKAGDSGGEHSGFAKAFNSVEREILQHIPEKAEVFIAGHSLGGALASIAFQTLKKRNKVMCYTYGAPPVGVNEFQYNHSEDEFFRFINHGDIVPRVMKVGAVVIFLATFILPLLKCICLKFNWKTEQFLIWDKHLNNFSKDLMKYKQPVRGVLLKGDGKFVSNSDENFSFTLFFNVLFSQNPKELLSDHGIQKYCDEIEKVS